MVVRTSRRDSANPLVLPRVQLRFVKDRCAAGQSLQYRTYKHRDHLSLLASGSPLVGDLLAWTEARFASRRPAAGCNSVLRR
jgi:hypothetical protein